MDKGLKQNITKGQLDDISVGLQKRLLGNGDVVDGVEKSFTIGTIVSKLGNRFAGIRPNFENEEIISYTVQVYVEPNLVQEFTREELCDALWDAIVEVC